jgi:hypothetical protein|tara:strand:- start:7042 stop:8163 length:1122 start_codon:yes stop_codon:yes gene_type:complete
MAIKVSGTTVIDNDRNVSGGIGTFTDLDLPPQPITFNPTDGATNVALNSNIVITFNTDVSAVSGNVTLREGSASGSVIQTIDVTSGSVSISGGAVTINPSDFTAGKNIFVVVDDGAFKETNFNSGSNVINTYDFTTVPISTSSFSPADGATGVAINSNIAITFSENIAKGTGNITLRAGSASGTIRQTIDVTSAAVSISGAVATINPPSDLEYSEDTYVVVDAGCFTNTDGDSASANAIINTYNFTTEADVSPGDAYEGGYLICAASNTYWIVAPSSTEVTRYWPSRNDAITQANSNAACGDWFVPTCGQLKNPGYACRTHWDSYTANHYWSNTASPDSDSTAWMLWMNNGNLYQMSKTNHTFRVRAFRTVSY